MVKEILPDETCRFLIWLRKERFAVVSIYSSKDRTDYYIKSDQLLAGAKAIFKEGKDFLLIRRYDKTLMKSEY